MTMSTSSRGRPNRTNGQGQLVRKQRKQFPDPKLRSHAVSVLNGDYSDYSYDNGDDDYELDETVFDKFSDDKWNIKNFSDDEEMEKWHKERETDAYKKQLEEDAKREKWIENAKAPVRVPKIDSSGRSYGKGGRKVSTARVWIYPGEGIVTVNRREFLNYFPRESDREMILSPFVATKTCGMFDVMVQVEGGGVTGKAGAIRHGVARALEKYNPDFRPPMKRLGFMTRDNRQVERKKIGLKKARKAPQWVRR